MQKYDLIIVGSGPAGLSAAVYGRRAGLRLLVIEKYPMSGGQVLNTYEVDNYLGLPGMNGFDMGMRFREHADRLNAEFLNAEVTGLEKEAPDEEGRELYAAECDGAQTESVSGAGAESGGADSVPDAASPHPQGVWIVHTDQGDFSADALILATGADHARLGVPGEEEFAGKGVSYCATCDGAFFRGKRCAVIGGGDVALEDAVFLARFCEKVYCIHRRDTFRGARILQEQLFALKNVEILYSHVAVAIEGGEMVERLRLQDVKTQTEKELPVDGVFIAVGIHPNTELCGEIVERDEGGYIPAGEDCAVDGGLFVAGDIRRKPLRQIVTAVADGANAAMSAAAWLNCY